MHRRYLSHWSNFEGHQLAPLNSKNNVDYITSSCVDWCIKEEHLYAVNKLAVFDHVKSISIEWRGVAADPVVLNALAQKMPVNSVIDRISISDESANNFLYVPAEPIQVHLEVVDGLINVMGALTTRHHPLIQLDIELPFHPSLHQRLVELLTVHTSLKHLSLEMIHMPAEVFKNIIDMLVTSHKSLKTLKFANITNATDEIVDLVIETITKLNLKHFFILLDVPKDDSRLMELETLGYIVIINGEHETKYVHISRKKDTVWPPRPIFPTVTNDEHQTNMIQTLPIDILQYMLNKADIKSLLQFKGTNKQIQSWFQTSTFWRQYYLLKASTITTDTLTAADLIYGSYIDRNRSVNFWQCISMAFTGSLLRRDVAECHSLNEFHERLVKKLLHAYPSLRMMESVWRRMSIHGKWKYYPKKSWFPSRLSFYILGSSRVVYHLNVDMTRPDVVGIRFFHGEISRMEEESNPSPKAIFDYFVSSSINEIINKVKSMVESMTVSMRSAHSYIYRHLPIENIIDCNGIPEVQKKCMKIIETTFDSCSKALLDELQLKYDHYNAFKNLVEQFSSHVSSVTIDHVTPEYAVIHHRIDQMGYNQIYQATTDQGRVGYWNFKDSFLEIHMNQLQPTKKPPKQVKYKEREKKIPHVALLCLFRKVLNLIMITVLKSLWLRNLNDIHTPWYSFDKPWASKDHQQTPLVSWYDYYCNKWQPLSSISVSRAKPSSWPMSAIAVGSRLAPLICEAVVAQVRHKWNGSKSEEDINTIEELIQAIAQYDLFPKNYANTIKTAFQ